MCLAIPVEITALHEGDMASVSAGGVTKRISLALLDGAAVGDFVLLHVGYALHKVSADEAQTTLALMAEAGVLEEGLAELRGAGA